MHAQPLPSPTQPYPAPLNPLNPSQPYPALPSTTPSLVWASSSCILMVLEQCHLALLSATQPYSRLCLGLFSCILLVVLEYLPYPAPPSSGAGLVWLVVTVPAQPSPKQSYPAPSRALFGLVLAVEFTRIRVLYVYPLSSPTQPYPTPLSPTLSHRAGLSTL